MKFLLLFLVQALLSGCIPVRTNTSDIVYDIDTVKESVVSGITTRSEIYKRFGDPVIQNKSLNIEVYRALEDNDGVLVFFMYLPIWYEKDDKILYMLVLYDEQGVVTEVGWPFYSEKGEERSIATASVKGFEVYAFSDEWFALSKGTHEFVLNDLAKSKESLMIQPPIYKCRLSIYPYINQKVSLDNKILYKLPNSLMWVREELDGFIQVDLQPGEHEIEASYRKLKRNFSCTGGEHKYIMLTHDIYVSDSPSYTFYTQRRILYHIDKWFN